MITPNTIGLVGGILETLAVIASAPEWGKRGAAVSSIIGITATALKTGQDSVYALQYLKNRVDELARANLPPTEDDWLTLKARSDGAHDILKQFLPAKPVSPEDIAAPV